jgi:signal transduction histidine kinase
VSAIAAAALAASDAALLLDPAERPDRPAFTTLFATQGVTLAVVALALAALALRPRRARRAIARLAAAPGGSVAAALAEAVGEPELRIAYPLSGGSLVDATGAAVAAEEPAARIVRGGDVVAVIRTASGTPELAALDRALGPPARLALANERLRAEQLARLRELTELRRRIVATGDAARRRLERDLHDGAQQRLLALAIDLRVALTHAENAGREDVAELLRRALERAGAGAEEVRAVAHGVFPSTLASYGLAAALGSLAELHPLAVSSELEPGRRFPDDVETAAYAVVADATAGSADPATVRLEQRDGALVVTVDGAGRKGGGAAAEDRVGAAAGIVTWSRGRLEARLPLPPPS